MANRKIKVKTGENVYEYQSEVTLLEIVKDLEPKHKDDIIIAKVDGKLSELSKKLHKNCEVELLTIASREGYRVYKRSCLFLMIAAIYDICPKDKIKNVEVLFSIDNGYYCEIEGDVKITEGFVNKLKKQMNVLAEQDIPITKQNVSTDEARVMFKRYGLNDKEKLLRYRTSSRINIYSIKNFKDYFYGYMVGSTKILKYFDIVKYKKGFVIKTATSNSPKRVPKFIKEDKLYEAQVLSRKWATSQNIKTVGDLNEYITHHATDELVLVQEAFQEKCIADIATDIESRKDVKFVLIAGPSSSGKTSFSNRLSIQLKTRGYNPHPIACDNFFVDRIHTPRDENGEYDFEHFDAVDRKLLNMTLKNLLNGKEVKMPTFNFRTGVKEFKGDTLKLGDKDILIIEGIHCLNDKLTASLDKKNKYKIYISALTQINIDEHNRIPTTDDRLIRRIIRDHRTRGTSAQETIKRWPSVRRGEIKYIFPFQEGADAMYNSAMIYELAVYKQYLEPLLYSVPVDSPEFVEAKRLLKFVNYFIGFDSTHIPNNSIIREFIGGSCFNVG